MWYIFFKDLLCDCFIVGLKILSDGRGWCSEPGFSKRHRGKDSGFDSCCGASVQHILLDIDDDKDECGENYKDDEDGEDKDENKDKDKFEDDKMKDEDNKEKDDKG